MITRRILLKQMTAAPAAIAFAATLPVEHEWSVNLDACQRCHATGVAVLMGDADGRYCWTAGHRQPVGGTE